VEKLEKFDCLIKLQLMPQCEVVEAVFHCFFLNKLIVYNDEYGRASRSELILHANFKLEP
jgi:hypothetical protein